MPKGAASPRRELDAWQDWAKARGAKGLAYILVGEDGSLGGPVAKNLSEKESKEIASFVGAKMVMLFSLLQVIALLRFNYLEQFV